MGDVADVRGDRGDARPSRTATCFEVDPYDQDANRDPKPIKALGRYAHEAVVVDPDDGRDLPDRGRRQPQRAAVPLDAAAVRAAAGQGLAAGARRRRRRARGDAGVHARRARSCPTSRSRPSPGTTYRVGGSPVPDRDAPTTPTRKQFATQITRSRKLEGMWWGDGGAYFVALVRAHHRRQRRAARRPGLVPRPATTTRSSSSCTSPTRPTTRTATPTDPTTSRSRPTAALIIAEDGDGKQHLVGATEAARCSSSRATSDPGDSEFAGPTFSHDKKILFANIQSPGLRVRDPGTVPQAALNARAAFVNWRRGAPPGWGRLSAGPSSHGIGWKAAHNRRGGGAPATASVALRDHELVNRT